MGLNASHYSLPEETVIGVRIENTRRAVTRAHESAAQSFAIEVEPGRYPLILSVSLSNGIRRPYLHVRYTGVVVANGYYSQHSNRTGPMGHVDVVNVHTYGYEALGLGHSAKVRYELTTEGKALLESLCSYDSGLI